MVRERRIIDETTPRCSRGARFLAVLRADSRAERARADQARARAGRSEALVRHATDAGLVLSRDGRIVFQTPSVASVLGFLPDDLQGLPVERIAHPDEASRLHSFLEQVARSPASSMRTIDAKLLRADDTPLRGEVVGLNLLDEPDVGGLVLWIRDVSGRHAVEGQLRYQAFHDPLTGLSNRALFADRAAHALDRARREDSPTPAVAYLDLDDFKQVNDELGHGAGDQLLRVVADRLSGCLRAGDTPARLGGDEFAVLLEDAADVDGILEVAERVLDAVAAPVVIDGHHVRLGVSIGVATREGVTAVDDLLRNADLAMYAAKAAGKGCVRLFEPGMHRHPSDRQGIRDDLRAAVERDTIEVAYQPIVRLASGDIVGFEALARWTRPGQGSVSPVEFLAVADDIGLLVPLGSLVLRQACKQLARWNSRAPGAPWFMAINLSEQQVLEPGLVDRIRAAIEDAGVSPTALVLELPESVLLADSETVLGRLHQIRDLGVRIAIDDVGTGYSSLSYLQRVPFDILKVDRAFVSALRQEVPATTLVSTIVDLARTLRCEVVAEGIEEQAELEGLVALGCDLGQGYHFSRPLDAARMGHELSLGESV